MAGFEVQKPWYRRGEELLGQFLQRVGGSADQYNALLGAGIRAATGTGSMPDRAHASVTDSVPRTKPTPLIPGPGDLSGLNSAGGALVDNANGLPLARADHGVGSFRLDPRAVDVAAWLLPGASRLPGALAESVRLGAADMARGGVSRVWAGPKSATWDAARADQFAAREAADGADFDPTHAWRATGTARVKDGSLVQEIDDSALDLRKDHAADAPYWDVVKHENLARAYAPLFNDVKVDLSIDPGMNARRGSGSYNSDTKKITVRAKSREDALRILTHETNHAISRFEGRATGGSPDSAGRLVDAALNDPRTPLEQHARLMQYAGKDYDAYHAMQDEVLSRAAENRRGFSERDRYVLSPDATYDVDPADWIVSRADEPGIQMAADGGQYQPPPGVKIERIRGLPDTVNIPGRGPVPVQPHAGIRKALEDYKASAGIDAPAVPTELVPVNPKHGKAVADAFEAMRHAPNDPKVKRAYGALADETLAQWNALKGTGVKVEFIKPGMEDPYKASPRLAHQDVIENNHLWVYPTDSGFGSGEAAAAAMKDNPMLAMTDEVVDGKRLRVNDVFRIVHDLAGHIAEGNGFRANGEELASQIHAAYYSPEARKALMTETRGQNSWVNFGPHGEANRAASSEATTYAPQKIGLLPDWATQQHYTPPEARSLNIFKHDRLTEDPGRARDINRYDPPRGAPDYAQRVSKNKRAYNELLEQAKAGMTEDGLGWYNTEEIRNAFHDELGPEEGQKAYELYIDLVAATSAGAKTPANARIAGYYYNLARNGRPIVKPAKGSGFGHKAQNLHYDSAREIIDGKGGLLEVQNPKRYTFAENLKGNWKYATVDKHNIRAIGMASRDPEFLATKLEDAKAAKSANPPKAPDWWKTGVHGEWDPRTFNPREWFKAHPHVKWDRLPATWFRGAPTKTDYAAMEAINVRLAKDLGVTPAQAQAALWLGAGKRTGLGSPPKAFAKVFEDRVLAAAKRDGVTPEEALSNFIRGKSQLGRVDPTLLGLLGIAGAGGAAVPLLNRPQRERSLLRHTGEKR